MAAFSLPFRPRPFSPVPYQPAFSLSGCDATTPTALFSCSSSFLFFPFPFCCRRTPLVGARCRQTSAAWKSAGSEAFAGWPLPLDRQPCCFLSRLPAHSFGSCQGWQTVPDAGAHGHGQAGALLWFVLAAAKRLRPPSALDAKLFLLVAPWGPIAFYFLYRIQK